MFWSCRNIFFRTEMQSRVLGLGHSLESCMCVRREHRAVSTPSCHLQSHQVREPYRHSHGSARAGVGCCRCRCGPSRGQRIRLGACDVRGGNVLDVGIPERVGVHEDVWLAKQVLEPHLLPLCAPQLLLLRLAHLWTRVRVRIRVTVSGEVR